jgi:hypothetical protein
MERELWPACCDGEGGDGRPAAMERKGKEAAAAGRCAHGARRRVARQAMTIDSVEGG